MVNAMRMSRHCSSMGSLFVLPSPRRGSSLPTMAVDHVFIKIIDYLLLFLLPVEDTVCRSSGADIWSAHSQGEDSRACARIGRSERRVALA